jgi:hypothetical protein
MTASDALNLLYGTCDQVNAPGEVHRQFGAARDLLEAAIARLSALEADAKTLSPPVATGPTTDAQ